MRRGMRRGGGRVRRGGGREGRGGRSHQNDFSEQDIHQLLLQNSTRPSFLPIGIT